MDRLTKHRLPVELAGPLNLRTYSQLLQPIYLAKPASNKAAAEFKIQILQLIFSQIKQQKELLLFNSFLPNLKHNNLFSHSNKLKQPNQPNQSKQLSQLS
jgi:hypothetical protein